MAEDRIDYAVNAPLDRAELRDLLSQTDWARDRALADIDAMLAATPVWVSAYADGRLIGFARALSDGVYRALIEDVVVDTAWRSQRIGTRLMRRLIGQLDHVELVQLDCGPEMEPFYGPLGFTRNTVSRMSLKRG